MTIGSLSGVMRLAYDGGAMATYLPMEPDDKPGNGNRPARMRPQRGSRAGSEEKEIPLSERVSELRVVRSTHDVRAARVSALRAQIRSGTYRVDPELIARRILEQGL